MRTRVDVAIGPVQGFVIQSRRTRDLWGSSYLLAFLSAHAMRGACEAGGELVRPSVHEDPLYLQVCGKGPGDPPRIGSVPNRFTIETDEDPKTVAAAAIKALEEAWKRACQAVWDEFVGHAAPLGRETGAIWKRQVESFWEVAWTAGPVESAPDLYRRKLWRTHLPPDEPGDKCTVMHEMQELSGFVRGHSAGEREKQDAFWAKVRSKTGELDIRQDERLCAVTLVKRLFPKVAKEALGWPLEAVHWPSVVRVAATPWVRDVLAHAPDRAKALVGDLREHGPKGAVRASSRSGPESDFSNLDASYFHEGFVRSEKRCPLDDEPGSRDAILDTLKNIRSCRKGDGRTIGKPSAFYAMLLADGDRLGKIVLEIGGDEVARGLRRFSGDVYPIVQDRDGVLIYAGGDDVLVMLPVESALGCADAMAQSYSKAFGGKATLSAAVVFGHVRIPLGAVLSEAHRLLERSAKEANGRNSMAAAVLKRGGLHSTWVSTWDRTTRSGSTDRATGLIERFADALVDDGDEPGLSSSLIYRLRETLGMLCNWPRWEPGVMGVLPEGLDLDAFLRAEISRMVSIRSDRVVDKACDDQRDRRTASQMAVLVEEILRPSLWDGAAPRVIDNRVGVDGLMLARFLASGGSEEESA